MKWINLEQMLWPTEGSRLVSHAPALDHRQLGEQALQLAAGLQQRGIQRLAIYLEDAAELAVALLGAWRAGVEVLLPADLQAQTRQRWNAEVDLWLSEQDQRPAELFAAPLAPADLDLDACRLSLCTSGSTGAPKRIDKCLRQLANEVNNLEALWGAQLGLSLIHI